MYYAPKIVHYARFMLLGCKINMLTILLKTDQDRPLLDSDNNNIIIRYDGPL